MQTPETQSKALAAALAGLVTAGAPIVLNALAGLDYEPGAFETLADSVKTLAVVLAAVAVSWFGVWIAPRNRPKLPKVSGL